MKKYIMIVPFLIVAAFTSCDSYVTPDPTAHKNDSIKSVLYVNEYDQFANKGQYNLPEQKLGTNYWVVVNSTSNTNDYSDNSLRTSLIAESIIGLTAMAVNEGRGTTMVWSDATSSEYIALQNKLNMTNLGKASVWELLEKPEIKQCVKGYVLCNMLKQESLAAATVAAHVYQSIIVDTYNEAKVKALGYTKTYDASSKTSATAWTEFKDSCNNNGLVLMPTLTANNKGFAIAHKLMFINYNKKYASTASGNNSSVCKEILAWLAPLSPVIGWEQNIDEHTFVDLVSQSGNLMVPADWLYNLTLTSANYSNNQTGLATVSNPRYINFSDTTSYASFFLTDGDNVQWMVNSFQNSKYYLNSDNLSTKISFGLPICNLATMIPQQLTSLLANQAPSNSIIEYGGAGYMYADDFASNADRTALLTKHAVLVGNHMKQRRVKILGLFCNDVSSAAAQEAYQTYISQNDQLIGMIAVQYDPYAGGNGNIFWFKNSKGINIPVVTTRYSIWNMGNTNSSNQGTPAFVASKINELAATDRSTYSLVAVHAWSAFSDIGSSNDPTAENANGSYYSATPASWCMRRLNSKVKVVNTEELIWQLRMKTYPEETKNLLTSFY
jgi:hypothetical protein